MRKILFALLLLPALWPGSLLAQPGKGFEISPEGAWCWFADPRAIRHENPGKNINKTYVGYIDVHGNIKAMQYDFVKNEQVEVLIRSWFQPDDHNNPTFLVLPDDRVMVFYSRHTDERCFYYRISRKPGDLTTLGEEKRLETDHNTTYPSPFILADDPEHIYLCWRGLKWHPTVAQLSLPDGQDEVKFTKGPYQMVRSTGARPYAKYASDGKNRIYMAYTTGHPDNESPNFLYFNYLDIRTMTLHDVQGTQLSSVEQGAFPVNKSKEYAEQYPATVVDNPQQRNWVWQVAIDKQGAPVIGFVRISEDKKLHDYYYGKWTGTSWQKTFLANGGGHFHQTDNLEMCYSGGMAIDPDNVNEVYGSVPVEGRHGRVYELIRYRLDAAGTVVSSEAVTRDSEKNNVRPYLVQGSAGSPLRLTWMYGDYYDWIVSNIRPGYPTAIHSDFKGMKQNLREAGSGAAFEGRLGKKFTISLEVAADTSHYEGTLFQIGSLSYRLNGNTLKPEIIYKDKVWPGTNVLGTAGNWKNYSRGTSGKWFAPVKSARFNLAFTYEKGVLSTFINGLLDQRVEIGEIDDSPVVSRSPNGWVKEIRVSKSDTLFRIQNPDYKVSPFTGMTRSHWVEAAEYLLDGAFSYIHSMDDPMKFPKQHDKTYPLRENQVPTEKLEGFCRTLFVAAPLLREKPDLELNGIKVADYYRHNLLNLVNPQSPAYIKHRGNGGPSQILVEFGALAISLSVIPEILWDPLTKEQQDALAATMLSYGDGPTIGSNWRFFNIFVLSFFKDKGYAVNEALMQKYLDECLAAYRGYGWYNDSPAYDYYSMWAFQMYGPVWSELYGKKYYPQYASRFMSNLSDLAGNYPYMFNKEGHMNMWGRSIAYRFAAAVPLALTGYLEDKSRINYGWMRRVASSTLLQFLENPEFLEDRVPTLGFYGPFEPAVQIYSCRGSVYWMGKAFLALLLPAENEFWAAKENNGAWEQELEKGKVYNRFQPGSELLITSYPNSGAAEVRSWCHETVAGDWQKFRSGENYNKLAYNTDFPWMADGQQGEISMNYGVINDRKEWEVLRLYTFRSFENGVYRRDAELETSRDIKFRLADIPLADGILRVDKVISPVETGFQLGHYALPDLGKGIHTSTRKIKGKTARIIRNGEYQLAVVPVEGWEYSETVNATGLHPVSEKSAVISTRARFSGEKILITLQLWKKGDFTRKELSPVKSARIAPDKSQVDILLMDGSRKTVRF